MQSYLRRLLADQARGGGRIDYVELLDTTLRDGSQTRGVTFTLHDKVRVAQLLDELGMDIIEAGWPGSNPKDSEVFRALREAGLSRSRVAAFGSTRRKGVRAEQDRSLNAIVEADVPVAVIFGKSWTLHVTEVLRCSLDENLMMVTESVEYLVDHGLEVVFDAEHFFDGYKESPGYALSVLRCAAEGGARTVVLCDTNGGTLPHEVERIVGEVMEELGGRVRLGIHTHDDTGCAVANSLLAVKEGARHVQGTMIGLGERCGNADLTQVVPTLVLKMGFDCLGGNAREKLPRLREVALTVSELTGFPVPPNHPYIGRNAFAHKAGVHIDAVLKTPRAYEHVDPSSVGNERSFSVSELAGRSAIVEAARRLGLSLTKEEAGRVLEEVKRVEAEGNHLEGAEATVALVLLRALGMLKEPFRLISWSVETGYDGGSLRSRATVTVSVGESIVSSSGHGVGPVHALDVALRRALVSRFRELEEIGLSNYKVSVIDSGNGTSAGVRVYTEFRRGHRIWSTTALSRNVVDASVKALVDGYVYALVIGDREGSAGRA
jgi:2-isopropylmalate synthase